MMAWGGQLVDDARLVVAIAFRIPRAPTQEIRRALAAGVSETGLVVDVHVVADDLLERIVLGRPRARWPPPCARRARRTRRG